MCGCFEICLFVYSNTRFVCSSLLSWFLYLLALVSIFQLAENEKVREEGHASAGPLSPFPAEGSALVVRREEIRPRERVHGS